MTHSNEQLTILYNKWLSGDISDEEDRLFFELLQQWDLESTLTPLMKTTWDQLSLGKSDFQERHRPIVHAILKDHSAEQQLRSVRVRRLRQVWMRYAAILLFIAGIASVAYLLTGKVPEEKIQSSVTSISPGGNHAILTLADGSVVMLDSAANGHVAVQGSAIITKTKDGSLAYNGSDASANAGLNTLNTPNGGQYQLTLPDGSKVWLNAASSITFSTAFVHERKVTMTGEAYFEIAESKNHPFRVNAGGSEINVLGTSFNVNVYDNEPKTKTSLVSGSIMVDHQLLKPGQALTNGTVVTIKPEQELAWKNGLFNWEGASLEKMLREIARWYDLKVRYEGPVPAIEFGGEMSRSAPLEDVLKVLKGAGVHYRMESGRTIVITR